MKLKLGSRELTLEERIRIGLRNYRADAVATDEATRFIKKGIDAVISECCYS